MCSSDLLPEDMAALRAYADRLEEKYDVDILLSDQCAGPCAASWEDITTTDQAGLEDEVAAIYPALEALDRTLALYPDGFFAQFRNARGGVVAGFERLVPAPAVAAFGYNNFLPLLGQIGQYLAVLADDGTARHQNNFVFPCAAGFVDRKSVGRERVC